MKKVILCVMLAMMILSSFARASETFATPIDLRSDVLSKELQKSNLCYQLAAQGKVLREDITEPQWFESTDTRFLWRISALSSGLVCRVLVEGRYNLQFGNGAKKLGCECQGQIEISK